MAFARAGTAAGPGVQIALPGGGSAFVGKSQIEAGADVPTREYTLRAVAGEAGQQNPHGGLSVRGLISLAGVDPDGFGYLTVPRADGTTAYLAASDFAEPPPFPEGPALVWVDANSTRFFRPVRDANDANAADNIATPGGEALQVGIHDGNLLKVVALASSHDPDPGEAVSFSALAAGALSGERVDFAWRFGDGSSADGIGATHSFSAPGTYEVTVTATGDLESGGESAPAQIVVGDPPQRGRAGAGAEADGGTERHGPDGRGAGGGDGSVPTASGDALGSPSAAGAGNGGGPGSGGGSQASSRAGSAAPSSSFSGSEATPERPGAASAAAAAEAASPQASAAAQRTVSGVLVADSPAPAITASGGRPSAVAGGEPSSASAPRADGTAVPLALLALAALLVGGALYEWWRAPLWGRR